jgi:Carboxylesterase family
MHTDYYYFTSLVKSVAYHVMADAPPAYVYHFSYQNRLSRLALGVPQGDDTQYMLPRDDGGRLAPKVNSDEMKVAQRLISMVKNFIQMGLVKIKTYFLKNNILLLLCFWCVCVLKLFFV